MKIINLYGVSDYIISKIQVALLEKEYHTFTVPFDYDSVFVSYQNDVDNLLLVSLLRMRFTTLENLADFVIVTKPIQTLIGNNEHINNLIAEEAMKYEQINICVNKNGEDYFDDYITVAETQVDIIIDYIFEKAGCR